MKSSKYKVMAAVLMTAASSASLAEDNGDQGQASKALAGRYYLAPLASYTLADSKRGTDDGVGGALAVGKQLSEGFSLELSAVYTVYGASQGGSSTKLSAVQTNVLFFPGQMNFYGLLGMGFGEVRAQPGAQDRYANSLWNAGVGYLLGPFDLGFGGIALRMEALFRGDSHSQKQLADSSNGAFREAAFNIGLMIPIGSVAAVPGEPQQTVAVVPVAETADSDADGVADASDQCPGTAAAAVVDAAGCEAGTPAAAAAVATVAEAASTEATPDCKPPEPGQAITEQGCAAPNRLTLTGIDFDSRDTQLSAKAQKILDELAEGLQASPKVRLAIHGVVQDGGDADQEHQLAGQRAQRVSEYLVGKGVNAERIAAVDAGTAAADMLPGAGGQVQITILQ